MSAPTLRWFRAFIGWTDFRWAGRVLVGTDPAGRAWSIGEVEPPRMGRVRAYLYHPERGHGTGPRPLRRDYRTEVLARRWLECAARAERPDRAVAEHPEAK